MNTDRDDLVLRRAEIADSEVLADLRVEFLNELKPHPDAASAARLRATLVA